MDLYKDAVCNELRQVLTAWEMRLANPNTKKYILDSLRLKIEGLCAILDQIEKTERKAA